MSLSRMRDFADSINLGYAAEHGFSNEMKDTLKMTSYRQIAQRGVGSMNSFMQGAYNRGMQFAGASTIKGPADVQGDMMGQIMSVNNDIYERSEKHKLDMQRTYLSVLQHEDQMELEQERLRRQEADMLDQLTQFASLASVFV